MRRGQGSDPRLNFMLPPPRQHHQCVQRDAMHSLETVRVFDDGTRFANRFRPSLLPSATIRRDEPKRTKCRRSRTTRCLNPARIEYHLRRCEPVVAACLSPACKPTHRNHVYLYAVPPVLGIDIFRHRAPWWDVAENPRRQALLSLG